MNLAFNQESQFLLETTPMKITRAENNADLETLSCRIVEVTEEQSWDAPAYPTDDAEFRNDTIYRHPRRVSVRVFVKALAQNYTQARSAGYAEQKDAGTKNVKPIERKSTLKGGVDFGKGLF